MRTHKILAAVAAAALLSALVSATPAEAAATQLGYKHLTAVEIPGGSIKVSWLKTTHVKKFTVKTAGNFEMTTDLKSYKVSKSKVSVIVKPSKFSKAGTGNYTFIRLYALKSTGVTVQSKSAIVRMTAAAPDTAATPITIASYNVRTQKSDPDGHTWASRVSAIGAQIQAGAPAIVAAQEAGEILADNGYTAKVVHHDFYWQFQSLRDETNKAGPIQYALVDDQEYSKGAGREGTRILYDPLKVTVIDHGSFAPSTPDSFLRYVPWALFKDNATGKQFYFIDVHLDDRADKGKSKTYYNLRTKQTTKIISVAKGLAAKAPGTQVMVVGDFNSNIYSKPNNGADRQMISAGFFDGYSTAANTNEYYDTYNGFIKPVKKYSRVDYFFTIGGPRGSYSYKNWLVRSGTYPSDHDMQTAVLPF